jgi:hypothetical protein
VWDNAHERTIRRRMNTLMMAYARRLETEDPKGKPVVPPSWPPQ